LKGTRSETVVLGLAGSRTLIAALEDTLRQLPPAIPGCVRVVTVARHGFSVGPKRTAHNLAIEPGAEAEYYCYLKKAREEHPGVTIRTYTQCSFDGEARISRLCGVRAVAGAGPCAPLGPVAQADDAAALACAARMCRAVEAATVTAGSSGRAKSLGWELKRLLDATKPRDGYQATYLHDAKVLFAAASFDALCADGVLQERSLVLVDAGDGGSERVVDPAVDAVAPGMGVVFNDVLVAPERALDFHKAFVEWLEDPKRRSPAVDTVVTDHGAGHNGRKGNWLEAQDCDDGVALLLAGPIRKLYVSDDTPLRSRAAACLADVGWKISGGIALGKVAKREGQVAPESVEECAAISERVCLAVANRDVEMARELDEAFRRVGALAAPRRGAAFDPVSMALRAVTHVRATSPSPDSFAHVRDVLADIDRVDADALLQQCFVPTHEQLDALLAQSVRAEEDLRAGRQSKLLSKLPQVPALCPPSFNPRDTILVKLGKSRGRVGDDAFRTIPDQALAMWTSFGPNSVVLEPDEGRINLVSSSRAEMAQMLDNYIEMRSAWLPAIIKMLPDKIRECRVEGGGYSQHFPPKTDKEGNVIMVPKKWWAAYDAVEEMLDAAAAELRHALFRIGSDAMPEAVLRRELGLDVVSLCQTWMRGSGKVGDAEFSVMSPHFQNRLVVLDAAKLMRVCRLSPHHVEAYRALSQQFAANMEAAGYSGKKGPAFMHLDGLHKMLHSER